MEEKNTQKHSEKIEKPKVERIMSNGIEVEKTTYPDGREEVVVLGKKSKIKSNPDKDE